MNIATSQVGINTETPSSASSLHVVAQNTDGSYGGMIIPTLTTAQLAEIALDSDSEGLMLFHDDGTSICLQVYNATREDWDIINCKGTTSDIFISEYIEGTSLGNKYLELYNPTASPVDLSNYKIILLRNGGTLPVDGSDIEFTLSGNLNPGQTFVISDDDETLYNNSDFEVTSLNFNGDDPILLTDLSNTIIDIIGVPGTDPGDGYSVDDATTSNATVRRNKLILQPTATWTPSQWSVYPLDDVTGLGKR